MKKCSSCQNTKPEAEFNFKNKIKGIRNSQCKICTRKQISKHYLENTTYYLQKAQKRNTRLRNEANTFIFEYLLRHPCIDCGETDPIVLEFDHKGEIPKLKAVSQLMRVRPKVEKLKVEIDKCEVRCANCHRRKTAKDFKWFKFINNTPL